MNEEQWLFACLAEEANEVAQAASKVVRFGANDDYPGYGNNIQALLVELNGVHAVVQELKKRKVLPMSTVNPDLIEAKKKKLAMMMDYAKSKGIVK